MDYASNANAAGSQFAKASLGSMAGVGNQPTPSNPTVASALGRIESLNGRLREISSHLASISDAVGGPRPASTAGAKEQIAPNGIVYRLNDGAEAAHRQLSEIEEIIGSIGRALG